jgi:hypothetical protein
MESLVADGLAAPRDGDFVTGRRLLERRRQPGGDGPAAGSRSRPLGGGARRPAVIGSVCRDVVGVSALAGIPLPTASALHTPALPTLRVHGAGYPSRQRRRHRVDRQSAGAQLTRARRR